MKTALIMEYLNMIQKQDCLRNFILQILNQSGKWSLLSGTGSICMDIWHDRKL